MREWWEAPYIVLEVGSRQISASGGVGRPPLAPIPTDLLWYTAWWVLMSDGRCRGLVGRFGLVCGPPLLMLCRVSYMDMEFYFVNE